MRPEDRALAVRDSELPGLALLLDDDAVAAALSEQLPAVGVRAVRSTYIRYKPGTNCLVAFEIDTADGPRLAYGRAEHQDDEPKLRKAHTKARSGSVLVDDPPVALLLFPSDRRLRRLPAIMKRPATVLAYKPERRLVLRRARKVLKAYRSDTFPAAQAAAATVPAGLPVQRCVSVSARHDVLVFDWVDGRALDTALGSPDGPAHAAAARDALDALHGAAPNGALPRRTRAGEAEALVAAAEATAVAGPAVAQAAVRVARRLTAALPADGSDRALLHGDFSCDQVAVGEAGAVLLDLDGTCTGDPRWDLGSVIGDLELRVLDGRLPAAAAADAAAAFTDGHADALRPFAAAGLLRRATEPFRRRQPGWDALVDAAVERAAALASLRRPAQARHAKQSRAFASLHRIARPSGSRLTLRRAWPRADGRLLLEYRDERGTAVGAQAGLDADAIRSEHRRATRAAVPAPVAHDQRPGVLIHADGADGRLPALHGVLRQPGARLVSHRATRRAVVALDHAHVKVLRPDRTAAVAHAAHTGADLMAGACSVPDVLAIDTTAGTVTYATLPGGRLIDVLQTSAAVEAMSALGSVLRTLHAAPRPSGVHLHDAAREARVVTDATTAIAPYAPELARRATRAAVAAARRLTDLAVPTPVPVHRDLHDKKVLLTPGGRLGLLDFDTLALGDPALDLGNLLAHLELRALQHRCTPADTERLAAALLDGYHAGSHIRRRAAAYAQATRVRLACVYALRPAWPAVPDALLTTAMQPASLVP